VLAFVKKYSGLTGQQIRSRCVFFHPPVTRV